jgi:hypothetical protein
LLLLLLLLMVVLVLVVTRVLGKEEGVGLGHLVSAAPLPPPRLQ